MSGKHTPEYNARMQRCRREADRKLRAKHEAEWWVFYNEAKAQTTENHPQEAN